MSFKNAGSRLLLLGLTTAMFLGGCRTLGGRKQTQELSLTERNFYKNTIRYNMGPKAEERMKDLEKLLLQIDPRFAGMKKLPDYQGVAIYKSANKDNNRIISEQEADNLYNRKVKEFEDSVEPREFIYHEAEDY